ncbi:MAG: hypothetical protein Q9222_001452 [Ikaeria aurantiellina]
MAKGKKIQESSSSESTSEEESASPPPKRKSAENSGDEQIRKAKGHQNSDRGPRRGPARGPSRFRAGNAPRAQERTKSKREDSSDENDPIEEDDSNAEIAQGSMRRSPKARGKLPARQGQRSTKAAKPMRAMTTVDDDEDGHSDDAQDLPQGPSENAKGKMVRGILTPIEPDAARDEMDDEMRQVIALSHSEAQSAWPPELGFEEQLRMVMEQSITDIGGAHASSSRNEDEEEALRQIVEDSRREHEKQERIRARRVRQQQKEEDELARVIRESEETAAEDFRKHAERMSLGRDTVHGTPSWTESNTNVGNREESSPSAPAARARAQAASATAAKSDEPKKNFIRSFIGSPARASSSKKKARAKSTLHSVPENAVASSSSGPAPLTTRTKTKSNPSSTSASKAATHPPPSQALTVVAPDLRKPPIEPPALIALCDAAFPKDTAIDLAIAASKDSASIYSVQQGSDEDWDPAMAAAVAQSRAEATPALDITETGLDEPPPDYSTSANDRLINHMKFTTSDYRQEKIGQRLRITPEIWEIMRLYRELMTYYATIQKLNGEDVAKDRLGKPYPFTVEPAPPANAAELDAEDKDPMLQNSRPALRDDTAGPQLTESATHFMENLPSSARPLAKQMQDQSRMISQSRMPGSRPRQRPEAHMRKLNALPIMEEEEEEEHGGSSRAVMEEGVGERTRKRMQRDSRYRRSGI